MIGKLGSGGEWGGVAAVGESANQAVRWARGCLAQGGITRKASCLQILRDSLAWVERVWDSLAPLLPWGVDLGLKEDGCRETVVYMWEKSLN